MNIVEITIFLFVFMMVGLAVGLPIACVLGRIGVLTTMFLWGPKKSLQEITIVEKGKRLATVTEEFCEDMEIEIREPLKAFSAGQNTVHMLECTLRLSIQVPLITEYFLILSPDFLDYPIVIFLCC